MDLFFFNYTPAYEIWGGRGGGGVYTVFRLSVILTSFPLDILRTNW